MGRKIVQIRRRVYITISTVLITTLALTIFSFYINSYQTTTSAIKSEEPAISFVKDVPATSETFHVPILMYHHVSSIIKRNIYSVTPEAFEKQMTWLHDNGYNVIQYKDFYHALSTKTQLPEKSVVITFDDGWTDQYENAFPVLKKYGFSAMFFIPSGYIGKRSGSMDLTMLKDLVKNNMEIGSHTVTHALLSKVPKKQLDYELTKSKKTLEDDLGITVDFFAYPGGDKNNFIIKAITEAGYLSALTTIPQKIHSYNENPYRVTRIHINNDMKSFEASLQPTI